MDYQKDFLQVKPTGVPLSSGVLLVSVPFYNDDFFNHAVVLLLDHNEEGAAGLIINKKTNLPVSKAQPSWKIDDSFFLGGPVSLDNILALHNFENPDRYPMIHDGLYSGLDHILLSLIEFQASKTLKYKFFLGYSGWAPGQLESEIERGMWVISEYVPEMIFDTPYTKIWHNVVNKLGQNYRHWLDIPLNISSN